MLDLLDGLRLAAAILFAACLLDFARNSEQLATVHRLRRNAWLWISAGMVVGFSPPRVADLFSHPLSDKAEGILTIIGLISFICGAVYWALSTVMIKGGNRKDLKRSLVLNVVLVGVCLVAGGMAR